MKVTRERIKLEGEITGWTLSVNGWQQDDDLYWHKDGFELNTCDGILWLKSNFSVHGVDSIKRLNECILNSNNLSKILELRNKYKIEF